MSPSPRIPVVDVVRGCAFLAMFVYHGAWFATEAEVLHLPIRTALGWITFQKCIAGTFFGLVGVSLQLSAQHPRSAFLHRLARVAGCAGVVTLTSVVLDPQRIVSFGILHAIALCSIAARPLCRAPSWALLATGPLLVAVGAFVQVGAMDHRALQWTGLAPRVHPTFDHQAFLPWFGVVVTGLVVGRWLQKLPGGGPPCGTPLFRVLGHLGRHSLLLYMAHVPLLIGLVGLVAWLS